MLWSHNTLFCAETRTKKLSSITDTSLADTAVRYSAILYICNSFCTHILNYVQMFFYCHSNLQKYFITIFCFWLYPRLQIFITVERVMLIFKDFLQKLYIAILYDKANKLEAAAKPLYHCNIDLFL